MISLKRNDSNAESQRRFQDAVHLAASLLNWVLPDSEEIVAATSHEDEEMHEQLPDVLSDPLAVLDRDQLTVHDGYAAAFAQYRPSASGPRYSYGTEPSSS